MLRKISVSLLALSVAGLAGSAMAAPINSVNVPLAGGDTVSVPVNINVLPTVSVWTNDTAVNLTLNGSGPNNATAAAGILNMVSNVAADVKVNVQGHLPADLGGGNVINFFLFPNMTDAGAVVTGINSNTWGSAYAPTGALTWTKADVEAAGGTDHNLLTNEPAHYSGIPYPIVYAADDPGGTPAVTTTPWGLTVTYTISQHT